MKLTVLGKYGACPPARGALSSYLLRGESTSVLLDAGSGSLSRLMQHTTPDKLDAIVLSHLHFDHMSDLLPMSYFLAAANKKIKVYLPMTPSPVLELLKSIKVFKLIDITKTLEVEIGNMYFEFKQMVHAAPSYAVKVSMNGEIFVYSGDTTFNSGLIEFCAEANYLLLDIGKTQTSLSHMNIAEAAFVGKSVKAKVLGTHIAVGHTYMKLDEVEIVEEGETYLID